MFKVSIILRTIVEDELMMIMNWRMSETVTRYLNTNPKLTIEGQRKWFASLSNNEKVRNWMIEVDGTPAGIINLADIDFGARTTSWGYYIGEESLRSLRLAISLEMSLYDYCFDILGLEEVHNEVLKVNEGVWKIHVACGCKIVRIGSAEVEKEGIKYDVVHLSIHKGEWYNLRTEKQYEKLNFDIFQDKIEGMDLHHIGIAVSDLKRSILAYKGLGWVWDERIIEDTTRNIRLAFLRRDNSGEVIELVCPVNEKSPVSNTLHIMKKVASPYHLCYEVQSVERMVQILKGRGYILTDGIKPAIAFGNRRIAFMLNREAGLIELLEGKGSEP